MKKSVRLTIAALVAALTATAGMAAPAEAKVPSSIARDHVCC